MATKKLGILTFHCADNLGAVLQCYALQNALEENYPVDVQIIDYRIPSLVKGNRDASGIKKIALQIYYWIKHYQFENFRKKYLHLSMPYTPQTIHSFKNDMDSVIVGSDQVWNYECTNSDSAYFLPFLKKETKKYAYAASLGRFRFSDQQKKQIRKYLDGFDGITVREAVAQKHLEDCTDVEITVVPDPVMLLAKEDWQKIMPSRFLKERYVFVYLILPDVYVMKAAHEYAKKHHCKVICNKESVEFILNGSPADFLSWIYHAERVFTNSFHGTAFSILLGKALGVEETLKDGTPNSRVQELLVRTGNERCVLRSSDDMGNQTVADTRMDAMIEYGYAYLSEICK